jgi:hypothetical protein
VVNIAFDREGRLFATASTSLYLIEMMHAFAKA